MTTDTNTSACLAAGEVLAAVRVDNPAVPWATMYANNIASCSELMCMGWTFEELLYLLKQSAQDCLQDTSEYRDYDDLRVARDFVFAPADQKSAATYHALRLLGGAIYVAVGARPNLTLWARRFYSLMAGWWPENVCGIPERDYSEVASETAPCCSVCKRKMGRHEEFRVVVYVSPTDRREPRRTRVPICWSCMMGAAT